MRGWQVRKVSAPSFRRRGRRPRRLPRPSRPSSHSRVRPPRVRRPNAPARPPSRVAAPSSSWSRNRPAAARARRDRRRPRAQCSAFAQRADFDDGNSAGVARSSPCARRGGKPASPLSRPMTTRETRRSYRAFTALGWVRNSDCSRTSAASRSRSVIVMACAWRYDLSKTRGAAGARRSMASADTLTVTSMSWSSLSEHST